MDPLEYENMALRDHVKLLSNAYNFERTMRNLDPDPELLRATRRVLGLKEEPAQIPENKS